MVDEYQDIDAPQYQLVASIAGQTLDDPDRRLSIMAVGDDDQNMNKAIIRARKTIAEADAIVIMAGAGIGVDSGLPDFRGDRGFWKAYPIAEKLGLCFTDLANPYQFEDDPRLAWAFYGHRLNLYRTTQPHAGFHQLLKLCQSKSGGYYVFTSNVDGQFQKAGFDEQRIVECHGSIHRLQCVYPCRADTWSADHEQITVNNADFSAIGALPSCSFCGGLARPNILLFDDYAWLSSVANQQKKRLDEWWRELMANRAKVAIIELGAGIAIPTVRYMSEMMARKSFITLIRINPKEAQVSSGNISLPLAAREAVQMLTQQEPLLPYLTTAQDDSL